MTPRILSIAVTIALGATAVAAPPAATIAKVETPAAKPADAPSPEVSAMVGGGTGGLTPDQVQFFESKVRPILSETCYKCHSAEQGKSKGGLTLDTKEGWEKGGDGGPSIVPGNPEKSLFIKAITYLDPDLQMPPKGEKLKDDQIATLTQWVKMGAPDPRKLNAKAAKLTGLTDKSRQHWAFQPVKRMQPSEIPTPKNAQWCWTPVDRFILSKIESKGLPPAYDVKSPDILLRRATYDLLGLPATPQEISDFRLDVSKSGIRVAFANVVERLLASPHYGERWGRYWLDTARYADTVGGDRNNNRNMDYRYPNAWTYRDWVVKALNQDMPYDKFIIAQIAADHMPESQQDKGLLAALGFLTVGERFPNANDVINDRIDVVSKGFLGLTVACARCHDHMFDPIPTKEYYALHGVFASVYEPDEKPLIKTPSPAQAEDYQKKLAAFEKTNREQFYGALSDYAFMFRQKAGAYLTAGSLGRNGATEAELLRRQKFTADNKLDLNLANGTGQQARRDHPVLGPWRMFAELKESDFSTRSQAIANEIAASKKFNPLVAEAFKGKSFSSIEAVADIYDEIFKKIEPRAKEFYKAAAESKDGKYAGFDENYAQLFAAPFQVEPANKLDADSIRELVNRWPLQLRNRPKFTFAAMNELEITHPGAPARAMVVSDKPNPQDSRVFIRGQQGTPGDVVQRRFLDILTPGGKAKPFTKGSGRIELAKAIASKENPLTARVMINRIWLHHFGEGFVRTPDDLGTMSEAPSHPELIDYLAQYFMDQNWSIKNVHRLIMNSHVYQISSATRKEFEDVDPENRLLWRANVRRLDFEAMRDSLLVYGAKLDRTVGGQPVNLTDEPYSRRRSVYGYIDRGNLPELMMNFDFSNPEMPNSKRSSTIVPQQALFLMNSAMSVDIARNILARPEVSNARDGLARVIAIYRVIFQREPDPAEIKFGFDFVNSELKGDRWMSDAEKAALEKKAKEKDAALAKRLAARENNNRDMFRAISNEGELVERKPLTPWETYAQALLFSNEAAYVN